MNADARKNRFEAELDHLAQARELWRESEWVVECLRSKSGTPLKELAEEEIVEWHRKVQR